MNYEIGQFRLFTGIPLPDEAKQKVSEITRGRLPIPYVNTANLHITLNFFGELPSDAETKLKKVFQVVCSEKKSFEIVFDRLVPHHNRQLHLTLKPNEKLVLLQKQLNDAFIGSGFNFSDRQYYPHVKLANMHMDNVMNSERKIESFPNHELQQLNFLARKIVLFGSRLLLHHAHHTPLMEAELL